MDEAGVREAAQAHGDAIAEGDLKRAMEDLTAEAKVVAGRDVGPRLPRPVKAAEIEEVTERDGGFDVRIRYIGEGSELVVDSRWEQQEGRPMVIELTVA